MRWFIAIAEKELELYGRHIALYGDRNDCNPVTVLEDNPREVAQKSNEHQNLEMDEHDSTSDGFSIKLSEVEAGSTDSGLSENDNDSEYENFDTSDSDLEIDNVFDSDEACSSKMQENGNLMLHSSSKFVNRRDFDCQKLL